MAYDVRYAYLSQLVYSVSESQTGKGIHYIDPTGGAWELIKFRNDETNGYQGAVFINTDTHEVVLANRGTEVSPFSPGQSVLDAGSDLAMGIGKLPSQYLSAQKALDDAQNIASALGLNPADIIITGHSLGGALSQLLAAQNGNYTETFNAYGAGNLIAQLGIPASNFNNINNNVLHYDPVSVLPGSNMIGHTLDYLLPQDSFFDSATGQLLAHLLRPGLFEGHVLGSHGIGNFINSLLAAKPGRPVSIDAFSPLSNNWFDLFVDKFGPSFITFALSLSNTTATLFTASTFAAPPRRDPLVLDLDNDGLETVGLNATTPLMFDIDASGIKKSVGWLKADDGFLVRDINGNGLIDSGAELFGDATALSTGGKAADGFSALADLDSNHDGKINSLDNQFANLRVWRDLNQDGISQSNELTPLTTQGIIALNVAATSHGTQLTNGNQILDLGSYTTTAGQSGGLGETAQSGDINFAVDTFHSQFIDTLSTGSVATLPDMQGAGQVRSLREAASLSGNLARSLQTVVSAGAKSRNSLINSLDSVIQYWAESSEWRNAA